ncbi:GH32 C-terminal domain-containing protein [Paenibacillus sp. WST5]|uniref:beta-fructofuranosidase n=2 Tax=Paenibacillus sedimenti TaxID=2770274 RepID=A0A926KKD5_9BACL|nr:GH32 C-terminal domain-containing protein [Paenibacillus sedimenti]
MSGMKDPIDYVFNNARYKADSDPVRRQGIQGNALLFDGYSTWITRSVAKIEKPRDAITLEAWVAPRAYEWGDDRRPSAIVNQHDRSAKQGYLLGMYRHGSWTMQLGLGSEWVEAWSENKPLEKNKWSYVVGTYDKAASEIKLYLNGELVTTQKTPKNATINPSFSDLLIGKNNQGVLLRGTTTMNMFNGVMDEVKIHKRALSADEIKEAFDSYVPQAGGNIPAIAEKDLAIDRALLADDRHRPQYHLSAPGHWMNEPHAPIYFNGQYHLFYQHNPQGPYWHHIHWGHWVSDDMVHWRDMPVALAPEKNAPDPDGTWSGSATYDENGLPVLFFTAGNDAASPNQSTGLARSTFMQDGDNDLKTWVKHPVPVTRQEPGKGRFGDFRDPFVFQDGDHYVQLVGSGLDGGGGTALVYTSDNLTDWAYRGPLFESNYAKYPFLGTVWELPVLLPVGKDQEGQTKHILAINPAGKDADVEVYYWLGTWNSETFKFEPDHEEPRLLDVGDYHFTGPSGFVDPLTGRTILFTVSQGERTAQSEYDAGWAHNGGLPVSLSLRADGQLGIEPIQELESLRGPKLVTIQDAKLEKANELLKNVKGDMLEIVMEFGKTEAVQYGIKVRRSQNGEEETLLYYDADTATFNVNREKSTLDPDEITRGIQGGKLELNGENLKLHIYLDRSMIEANANGLKSLTTRAYPSRSDSLGLQVWADGDVKVKSMEVWQMNSAYGPTVPAYEPALRPPAGELTNHDFQTGDLTGWTVVSGSTFSNGNVNDRNEWGWGGPFNMAGVPGKYHLWGIRPGEVEDGGTGELRSETFVLGGDGQIDFLIGGGSDINNLYIALVRASDGKVLMKQTGHNWEMYLRRFWDASAYIGEELYIQIGDKATGSWGHINIDDVNVPVKLNVSISTLLQQVKDYGAAGKLEKSLYAQLKNKADQSAHQLSKGSKEQAVKFLEDFLRVLDGSSASDEVREKLAETTMWLIAEWK